MDVIQIGGLSLRFLKDTQEAGASLEAFELTVQPNAKVPVPHFHETWDEMIYGLSETTTWRIDGRDSSIGPGESAFIRRGVAHSFRNDGAAAAICLCVLTPGSLDREYFRETAGLVAGGKPDPQKMQAIMLRYGMVPVPNG